MMKYHITLIIVLAVSFNLFAQENKLPENILRAHRKLSEILPQTNKWTVPQFKKTAIPINYKKHTTGYITQPFETLVIYNLAPQPQAAIYYLKAEEYKKFRVRYRNTIQIVVIESKQRHPKLSFKRMPPMKKHNDYYCESVYLGTADGLDWYATAPIPTWIYLQKKLKLKNGASHLKAAFRGLNIKDENSHTFYSCMGIINSADKSVIPFAKEKINSSMQSVFIAHFNPSNEQVQKWFITLLDSSDKKTATAVRHNIRRASYKAAAEIKLKWLNEDAGKKPVGNLLRSCNDLKLEIPLETLKKIMQSPFNDGGCYSAFMQFRKRTNPISPEIMKAWHFLSSKTVDNQRKQAEKIIIDSGDKQAGLYIGLFLTQPRGKLTSHDCKRIQNSGIALFRAIDPQAGQKLINKLTTNCKTANRYCKPIPPIYPKNAKSH